MGSGGNFISRLRVYFCEFRFDVRQELQRNAYVLPQLWKVCRVWCSLLL